MLFADLGLSSKVTETIEEIGYTDPTPIQVAAIPAILQGRDVLGIAQTGTGKTASFTLPLLTKLESGRARARMPRSLILCPTRELAAQVFENFEKYGKRQKLSVALLIGGMAFKDQERILDRGADVLIATPGRLMDHFERGKLMLTRVEYFVIDEADRMLDMGFIPDIEKISKLIPFTRQTMLFSATMPKEIEVLADKFLQNPARIEVAKTAAAAPTIQQILAYAPSGAKEKRQCLRDILNGLKINNAIIFSNRKKDVEIIFKSLLSHKFSVGALHGDMVQSSRMQVLDNFKNNKLQLLVASDVAARGLDIPDVTHVINYDMPMQPEDYVHRIGRTGRAGRTGTAVSMVTFDDISNLKAVEKLTGVEIEWAGEKPSEDDFEAAMKAKRRGGRNSQRGPEKYNASNKKASSTAKPTRRKSSAQKVESETVKKAAAPAKSSKNKPQNDANEKSDIVAFGVNDHIPDFLLRQSTITKSS
ncbi:MAG: DEAD/DEAH box helicase [Rhizobiales bacterium]|nr:DEAD/DEAH box helicase [Hyphomicrobiales bacterium]NRB12938.1 DEAD/DEAH box helicase [Hyphomicrobiales bacterium]